MPFKVVVLGGSSSSWEINGEVPVVVEKQDLMVTLVAIKLSWLGKAYKQIYDQYYT